MDTVQQQQKGGVSTMWKQWGNLWYIDLTIKNPDGSQNYNAAFRFNCVAEQDAIDAGLHILKLDGVSLREFLDHLEQACNTLKQAGIVPADTISDDTILGRTSSKSELLLTISSDIKVINERFTTSQLDECTLVLDMTHYYKPQINVF